jgi:hypothetical protein
VNKTRYKSLDKLAQDPRIVEIWSEQDSGDGLWAQLAPGYNWEGSSCLHEYNCRDLIDKLSEVTKGDPY